MMPLRLLAPKSITLSSIPRILFRNYASTRPLSHPVYSFPSKPPPAPVSHPPRLQNKVAVVTGSSSGLGRAISLAYASHGTKLIVCADLQPESTFRGQEAEAQPTHELINEVYGKGKAVFVTTDVVKGEDVKSAVAQAVQEGGRLDMSVFLARSMFGRPSLLALLDDCLLYHEFQYLTSAPSMEQNGQQRGPRHRKPLHQSPPAGRRGLGQNHVGGDHVPPPLLPS